jgi:cell wall assembly regulator SMI1
METMTLLWQRIERWLTAHAPDLLDELAPGASEEELIQVEAALGVKLPEDFKALYRLHNGGYLLPPWRERTLPLESMVQVWEMINEWDQDDDNFFSDEPPGPVQPLRGHPERIPFFWVGYGGEYLCLDLAPGPGGWTGQVILRPHEHDPARFITNSFEALIAQIADDLDAGKYLSFDSSLEVRLTEGKAARDQARRYDEQQDSPGKELLDQASYSGEVTEGERKLLYTQVLQMPQSSRIDRCRAYHELIQLHLRGQQHSEAERLLTAFESEARSLPPDHWVNDDLQEDIASVFADKRVIAYARQAVAEGDERRAFIFLYQMLERQTLGHNWTQETLMQSWTLVFKPWVTTEEQFEIYTLCIDLYLLRRQVEAATLILAQFFAQTQTRPPEDPVHDMVRDAAARIQHEGMKQVFRESLQKVEDRQVLELTRTYIASLSPQSRQIFEETLPHPPGHLFDVLERLWLAAMNKLEPDDAESL